MRTRVPFKVNPGIQELRLNRLKTTVQLTIHVDAPSRHAAFVKCVPDITVRPHETDSPERKINNSLATALAGHQGKLTTGDYDLIYNPGFGLRVVSAPPGSRSTRNLLWNELLITIINLTAEIVESLRIWPSEEKLLKELVEAYEYAMFVRTQEQLTTKKGEAKLYFVERTYRFKNPMILAMVGVTQVDKPCEIPDSHADLRREQIEVDTALTVVETGHVLMNALCKGTHPFRDHLNTAYAWYVGKFFKRYEDEIRERIAERARMIQTNADTLASLSYPNPTLAQALQSPTR